MEEIYNYLLGKLKNEYKTFNSIYQKLSSEETKEIFQKLEYKDKVSAINGIIDLMHRGQGNLTKLKQGDRAGRKSGKRFKTEALNI